MSTRFRFLIFCLGVAMGTAALSACAPTVDIRGNVPNPDKLAQIKPGVQTREQVVELLGTPSIKATCSTKCFFSNDIWYYVNKRTESFAFFQPTLLERQVIAIHFDKSGVVREIRRYKKEHGREITPVARTTPAPGEELGFIEQLFGNLGRFDY